MKNYDAFFTVLNKIKHDKIFVYASHVSFYILISAIPFITLSFSLINIFFSVNEQNVINVLLPFFPAAVQGTAEGIIREFLTKNSNGFISFSIVSILWSSSRSIAAIRRGLRQIYDLKPVSFFKDLLYSILQLFFMVLAVFSLLLFAILPSVIPSHFLVFFVGFFSFIFLFAIIYFLFTERKIPFKSHIVGSIAASLSWMIFVRIFSLYIKYFSNYSRIYGSLTAVLIIALWIYFSTIIFFFGAELNTIISSGTFNKKGNKKELF